MEIKFGGNWYEVVETRVVAGCTHYAIEDEPNHIDWITNPKEIRTNDLETLIPLAGGLAEAVLFGWPQDEIIKLAKEVAIECKRLIDNGN